MTYGSVCSGIEAATVAWHPLGWAPAWFAEVDPFPSAVLHHRWPGVENRGDFTSIEAEPGSIDLLVGGTPCQSFSVAGLRGGMDDHRGNLALEFLRLAGRACPRWVVWENVPGVLSSNGGRDFGAILGGLEELGYGWAYRTLDALYVGGCAVHGHWRTIGPVPQRRRRVFVVAHSGTRGRLARTPSRGDIQRFSLVSAAVLFERACLSGDLEAGREAGSDAAGGAAACLNSGGNDGGFRTEPGEHLVVSGAVARPLTSHPGGGRWDLDTETFVPDVAYSVQTQDRRVGNAHNATMVAFHATQDPIHGPESPCLPTRNGKVAVAYGISSDAVDRTGEGDGTAAGRSGLGIVTEATPSLRARPNNSVAFAGTLDTGTGERRGAGQNPGALVPAFQNTGHGWWNEADRAATVRTPEGSGSKEATLVAQLGVRRLTPVECERLMGFPDDYTRVPYRGKAPELCPDGPRYKALGNSMVTYVMRWIGSRIDAMEAVR